MEFSEKFDKELKEAFEYWKSKQTDEQVKQILIEKWITSILQKPVYDLLGQKRIEDA
jgi:hypothetical protein